MGVNHFKLVQEREMMNNTINEVVDNLAVRFGEGINPAVESLSAISQTVVQETANIGFIYTMLGVGFFGLSLVCLAIMVWAFNYLKTQRNTCFKETIIGFMMGGAIIFFGAGCAIALNNLNNWIAPTREVIREIVKNL